MLLLCQLKFKNDKKCYLPSFQIKTGCTKKNVGEQKSLSSMIHFVGSFRCKYVFKGETKVALNNL